MFCCHKCGHEWAGGKRQPRFKEICDRCGAYLHCCRNCRHHDTTRPNQCRIPNTDQVGDRAGLNFCDEFEFRSGAPAAKDDVKATQARNALDALFGDAESVKKPKTLDDLFG